MFTYLIEQNVHDLTRPGLRPGEFHRIIGWDYQIGFLDMAKVVELTLDQLDKLGILNNQPKQLGDILNADDEARQISRAINV